MLDCIELATVECYKIVKKIKLSQINKLEHLSKNKNM